MKKKNDEIVDGAWQTYRERCVPASASNAEFLATRRAFFSGAFAVTTALEFAIDNMTSEEASEILRMVAEETRRFNELQNSRREIAQRAALIQKTGPSKAVH